jgi:hypothetical protein
MNEKIVDLFKYPVIKTIYSKFVDITGSSSDSVNYSQFHEIITSIFPEAFTDSEIVMIFKKCDCFSKNSSLLHLYLYLFLFDLNLFFLFIYYVLFSTSYI